MAKISFKVKLFLLCLKNLKKCSKYYKKKRKCMENLIRPTYKFELF